MRCIGFGFGWVALCQWEGELWSKPTSVDAQSRREGTESAGGPSGEGWVDNDVRVNLVAPALTALFRRALPDVLRERVMTRIGASSSWSWHGYYDNCRADMEGFRVPMVSVGAHRGGGCGSACSPGRIEQLCLPGGQWCPESSGAVNVLRRAGSREA